MAVVTQKSDLCDLQNISPLTKLEWLAHSVTKCFEWKVAQVGKKGPKAANFVDA